MEDFLLRALIAGVGVALISGPLGCFVVWRRMAYFGDTLAHSALLGVALGLLLGFNLTLGIVATAIMIALLVTLFQHQKRIASDTLLGILAHSSLAISLVVLGLLQGYRVDLLSYLFGDVLAVTLEDIYWIYGGGTIALALLGYIWKDLLALTLHEELARAEGINITLTQTLFMVTVAIVIAIAMKVVGVLLITSLLIIPAAAARRFARTPEQMAAIAALIGGASVVAGLFGSLQWDTPSGPSVVVAQLLLFLGSLLAGSLLRSVRP
ncbi:metal ABC transporter permease [Kiloniella laminariae]|uniref:High-affinity zinc uptake system membrane protein ZnuB n=1 Tax=Kiloniella laminariae TaxID=454162 RepID=A0ABT4LP00_9PROT|nr:iron chelate uptake ABC transporter family permease subunit [Kiloniella laminariae]MCZ4282809.1 metal ABC transporter permease [Kiloniella laminariae]